MSVAAKPVHVQKPALDVPSRPSNVEVGDMVRRLVDYRNCHPGNDYVVTKVKEIHSAASEGDPERIRNIATDALAKISCKSEDGEFQEAQDDAVDYEADQSEQDDDEDSSVESVAALVVDAAKATNPSCKRGTFHSDVTRALGQDGAKRPACMEALVYKSKVHALTPAVSNVYTRLGGTDNEADLDAVRAYIARELNERVDALSDSERSTMRGLLYNTLAESDFRK